MSNEIHKSVLRHLKRRAKQRGEYISLKPITHNEVEGEINTRHVYIGDLDNEARRKLKNYFSV